MCDRSNSPYVTANKSLLTGFQSAELTVLPLVSGLENLNNSLMHDLSLSKVSSFSSLEDIKFR